MSVMIINAETVHAVLSYAHFGEVYIPHPLQGGQSRSARDCDLDAAGQQILRSNARAYAQRYREACDLGAVRYTWRCILRFPTLSGVHPVNAVVAIKRCDFNDYQCCDLEDWETTYTHKLTASLRYGFGSYLPGYDDAPWG